MVTTIVNVNPHPNAASITKKGSGISGHLETGAYNVAHSQDTSILYPHQTAYPQRSSRAIAKAVPGQTNNKSTAQKKSAVTDRSNIVRNIS